MVDSYKQEFNASLSPHQSKFSPSPSHIICFTRILAACNEVSTIPLEEQIQDSHNDKVKYIWQAYSVHPLQIPWVNLLLDVAIRCPLANSHFPDDTWIFLEVLVDGDKVKRTEQFTKEPMRDSWRLDESIEVLRVPNLLGNRYFSPIFYHFCRCHTPCCQTVGILFTYRENTIL